MVHHDDKLKCVMFFDLTARTNTEDTYFKTVFNISLLCLHLEGKNT